MAAPMDDAAGSRPRRAPRASRSLLFLLVGFAAPLLAVIAFSFMPPRTFALWQAPTLGELRRRSSTGTSYISFLWSLGLAAADRRHPGA